MHFLKCEICSKQRILDFYENHLKSESHIQNLNKPIVIFKYCDFCMDDVRTSSRNKHMKKHKAICPKKN